MNYEQKYKEALERARDLHDNHPLGQPQTWMTCEKIFPELHKSEDDSIRKELIERFKWELKGAEEQDAAGCSRQQDIAMFKRGLAWLEKQGEQKPIEQDTEIYDLWVYIREWNDKFGRLPKDEDELASCIDYVMKRQKPTDKVEQKHAWSEKHIADVFEKVGLARIVREQGNDQLTNAVQFAMIELSKQQNPTLSEEDRKHINNIISLLNQAKEKFVRESGQFLSWITEILWLNSLKDRVQPQPKQEWSEEDEKIINDAIWLIEHYATDGHKKLLREQTIDKLKSLKPNHWKPSEEQMEALVRCLYEDIHQDKELYAKIESLYNDLKNL